MDESELQEVENRPCSSVLKRKREHDMDLMYLDLRKKELDLKKQEIEVKKQVTEGRLEIVDLVARRYFDACEANPSDPSGINDILRIKYIKMLEDA